MPESPTDRPVPDNLLKEGTRREIMVGRGQEKRYCNEKNNLQSRMILKENTNLKERKIAEQNIVFSMKSLFAVKVQIHFLSGLLLKNI